MKKYAKTAAMVAATLTLSLGAGCKKKVDKAAPAGGKAPAATQVKHPRELLAYVGFRSPGKTIDEALALAAKFAPLPFTRESLLDMLAQQALLPRGLMGSVQVDGTFWLLGLDEKQVDGSEPSVVVLPIKDRKKFEAALLERMKKGAATGDLQTYEPREGQVGLKKIALVITDKYVIFPSSPKALEASRKFIEVGLLGRTPTSDVEVHVLMEQITRAQGDELDKEIARTVAEMKANMARQNKGPIDQKPVADATGEALQRWVDDLKSTRELVIGLDVSADGLTLSASGEGVPGGLLHKVIKRQRVGAPVGLERLPASSWLVLADNGNPEAARENAAAWGPAMDGIFSEADPKLKARLSKLVADLATMNDGQYTAALHRAPSGVGLTVSAVGKVKDTARASAALDGLFDALGDWVKAEARRQGEELPQGLEVKRAAFKHKDASGKLLSLSIPFPADKAEEKQLTEGLVGLPVTMGWAFTGGEMFVAAGKEAESQLKALVEGKVTGPALAAKADFKAAIKGTDNQVGMLYLSLVDLLRWFKGTPVEQMMPPLLRGDLKDPAASPVLTWGVDEGRTAMQLSLRLPAAHFLVFKPLLDAVMKSGGVPSGALLGPGGKGL